MGQVTTQFSPPNTAYFHPNTPFSPHLVAHYLRDITFPVTKQELIDYALNKQAPKMLIVLLQAFPNMTYRSVIELFREFWRHV